MLFTGTAVCRVPGWINSPSCSVKEFCSSLIFRQSLVYVRLWMWGCYKEEARYHDCQTYCVDRKQAMTQGKTAFNNYSLTPLSFWIPQFWLMWEKMFQILVRFNYIWHFDCQASITQCVTTLQLIADKSHVCFYYKWSCNFTVSQLSGEAPLASVFPFLPEGLEILWNRSEIMLPLLLRGNLVSHECRHRGAVWTGMAGYL